MARPPANRPGRASILAEYAEERQGLVILLVCWTALVLVALGVSIYSYVVSESSGSPTFLVWWGPIVFGAFKAIRTGIRLNGASLAVKKRLEAFDNFG